MSLTNALYAICRTRKYRLFGVNVETKPATSSARRVKISASSGSPSPLRYLLDMVVPEAADSRAHPNKAEDVWELSVWDPLPISLRLFSLFSPGHVLIYLIFLPLEPLHPRPSVTVFNTLLLQIILSCQLLLLGSRFAQQAKDNNIVQKEVMHEYDANFVQPRLHPVVRDVGTQISETQPPHASELVQVGTPAMLIQRSFHSRQSARASSHEGTPSSVNVASPRMFTPSTPARQSERNSSADHSRPSTSRRSLPASYRSSGTPTAGIPGSATTGSLHYGSQTSSETPTGGIPGTVTTGNLNLAGHTPNARPAAAIPSSATAGNLRFGANTPTASPAPGIPSSTTMGNLNFGGHMGVHTHSESPLRKTTSLHSILDHEQPSPRTSREMASYEQGRPRYMRQSSPVKHSETPGSSRPNPFASVRQRSSNERYPTMR